jgi:hypothetical protein
MTPKRPRDPNQLAKSIVESRLGEGFLNKEDVRIVHEADRAK